MTHEPDHDPAIEPEPPSSALGVGADARMVFLTDASAETEGLARKVRASGYLVVDVPLSLLRERAAVQPPALVLVDADAEGLRDVLQKLRELPLADRIAVFVFGREGGAIAEREALQGPGATHFFVRPADEASVHAKVEEVIGPPPPRRSVRPSSPPAPIPSTPSGPQSAAPLFPPSSQKISPRSGLSMSPLAPAPLSAPSLLPRAPSLVGPLSPELEQMLSEAEQRVRLQSTDGPPPSPEEEIEAVLPAELLEALDEPIDDDEDDELDAIVGPAKGTGSGTTGASGTGVDRRTGAGERLTALRREREMGRERERQLERDREREEAERREVERERELELERHRALERERERAAALETTNHARPGFDGRPIPSRDSDLPPTPRDGRRSVPASDRRKSPLLPPRVDAAPIRRAPSERPPRPRETSPSPPVVPDAPRVPTGVGVGVGRGSIGPMAPTDESSGRAIEHVSEAPPALRTPGKGVVLSATDAPKVLAEAIAARASGALAFGSEGVVRRVLLREGDIVTVASGDEAECLVAFLASRGEIGHADAEMLRPKLPPFGRHAGAALVAHGHLRQDQLWPVLRAHAEWLLGRCLRVAGGTVALEPEPAGRLKTEPTVFGGAPGVAVLVEGIRRVFEPQAAAERLGGDRIVIGDGDHPELVREAHLEPDEARALDAAKGKNVAHILTSSEDILPVAYALTLLGALSAVRGLAPLPPPEPEFSEDELRALDEGAIRARVRARMALVEEGDYFSVLGISRDATGYEVRKAFLALRREFEPSRLLTPGTVDLREDVEHVVVVLEEAYEILRDAARRERYRRAIEATS